MTERVSLSKILNSLESGSRPKGGIVNGVGEVFSLGGEHLDSNGGFYFSNEKYVTAEFHASMKRGIVKPNDVLIVKDGATTGKVSFVLPSFPYKPACINEHLFRLEINPQIADPQYVFYYLFSPVGNQEILSDFRGATVGGISQDFANKVKVPLPPLEEQRRIAGILARADRLRQMRRYALQLSDGYLQAVFLRMFGDPVTNPMGWEKRPLGSILSSIDSGDSPVCEDRVAQDYEWGVLKLSAVTSCSYLERENKAITSRTKPQPKLEVKTGDLLFSRKNTYNLVGASAYVYRTRDRLMLSDLIFRLNIEDNETVNPVFLWQNLIFPSQRKIIQKLAGGTAGSMPNISKGRLQTANILLPPIGLQIKYSNIVHKHLRLRYQQNEALRQADHLFDTLLHRAFRGAL
jgi:type I restriction enzyme, S subunit